MNAWVAARERGLLFFFCFYPSVASQIFTCSGAAAAAAAAVGTASPRQQQEISNCRPETRQVFAERGSLLFQPFQLVQVTSNRRPPTYGSR